jgi:hypothetical protein
MSVRKAQSTEAMRQAFDDAQVDVSELHRVEVSRAGPGRPSPSGSMPRT